MGKIKVYTKKNCSYCVSAKSWLKQRRYVFEEINLDDPAILQEFRQKYPELRTVPQIFIEDEIIGGFTDLVKSKLA
jgi:glutaredoxin 3